MHEYPIEPENLDGFKSVTDPQIFLSLAWQNEIHTQGLGSLVDFEILTRPFDLAGAYLISSMASVNELHEHLRAHLGKELFIVHLDRMHELYAKSGGKKFELFNEFSNYDFRLNSIAEVVATCRLKARINDFQIENDKSNWILKVAKEQADRAFDLNSEFNSQDRMWSAFEVVCELRCVNDLISEQSKEETKKILENIVKGIFNCPSEVLTISEKLRLLGACYASLIQSEEQVVTLDISQFVKNNLKREDFEDTLMCATSFLEGVSDFFDYVGDSQKSENLSEIVFNIDKLLFKDHLKQNEPIVLDDKPVGRNLLEDAMMNFHVANWGLEQRKAWCLSLTHRLVGNRDKELSALEQSVLASDQLSGMGLGVGSHVIYERSVAHMLPTKDDELTLEIDLAKVPELIKISFTVNELLVEALSATANLLGKVGQPSVPYEILIQSPADSLSKLFQSYAHGVCERFNPRLAIRRWMNPEVEN